MMSHAAGMFVVGPDGKACSARFGRPKWQPRVASAQLTETFPERNWGSPSAAAFCCATADVWTLFSQPYCAGVLVVTDLILITILLAIAANTISLSLRPPQSCRRPSSRLPRMSHRAPSA